MLLNIATKHFNHINSRRLAVEQNGLDESASQKPHHYFRKDFKDSYKVNLELLQDVQKQVAPFIKKQVSYSIDLDNGYSSKSKNFNEVLTSPLIESRQIRGMSLSTDYNEEFRFKFSLGHGSFDNYVEVSGYGDPLLYEGIVQQLDSRMKALRPWYTIIYNPIIGLCALALTYFSVLIYLTSTFPDVDINIISFFLGISLFFMSTTGKNKLFSRVEFLNGLSKTYADRRASWQKFLGITVGAGTLVALAREWLM